MNKTTLVFVTGLIILAGGYFWLRNGANRSENSAPSLAVPAPGFESTPEKTVATEGQSQIKEITITGSEFSFSPAKISVKTGEKIAVRFQNAGKTIHNLEFGFRGITTRTIDSGQSDMIEFTAPIAGVYAFFCSVPGHRERGMEGRLMVQ